LTTPELRVVPVAASALYELRRRILRNNDPSANVADPRDDEETALHLGGYVDESLVVSASFYPTTAPVHEELVSYQLRFMATDVDVQGRGYGAIVVESACDALRARGAAQVWAYARDSALDFYVKTGWSIVEGSEHLSKETNLPHTTIVKLLAEAA